MSRVDVLPGLVSHCGREDEPFFRLVLGFRV